MLPYVLFEMAANRPSSKIFKNSKLFDQFQYDSCFLESTLNILQIHCILSKLVMVGPFLEISGSFDME